MVLQFLRGCSLHGKAREIADIFPRFAEDLGAVIVPDALVPGDNCAWLKRFHFIESSNPLFAPLLIGRLWQIQVNAVVGGITRYDQTD